MKKKNEKKEIILLASQELTLRKFFPSLIREYANNDYPLTLISRDIHKLKDFLINNKEHNVSKINFIEIKFPKKLYEILNVFNLISVMLKLRKIFKKQDTKFFIHCNTPIASHISRIANIGIKNYIIYQVHGFRFHKQGNFFKNSFNYYLEYFLNFNTNFYITINDEDKFIIQNYFYKKYLHVNGVGVNLKEINNIKKKNNNASKIIGFIGAYKKEKGYYDIIELADKIKNLNYNIKCYGYGNNDRFQKIILNKKISNIEFNDFTYDIYSKMEEFDLFLCLSKREGLCVSILEAMALKIPVISTNIRGTREIIKNDEFGFLFEIGDINKVKTILIDFIENQEKYHQVANKAFNNILINYDAVSISKKINNKIIEIIKSDE